MFLMFYDKRFFLIKNKRMYEGSSRLNDLLKVVEFNKKNVVYLRDESDILFPLEFFKCT